MIEFNNYEEIQAYFEKYGQQSLDDIAKDIISQLQQYIDEKMNEKIPKNYDRTGDFRDSFSYKILGGTSSRQYGIQIYVDTNKIRPQATDKYSWNKHMSVNYQDVSKFIPLWMDEGHSGLHTDKGIYWVQKLKTLFEDPRIVTRRITKYFDEVGATVTTSVTFSFR